MIDIVWYIALLQALSTLTALIESYRYPSVDWIEKICYEIPLFLNYALTE